MAALFHFFLVLLKIYKCAILWCAFFICSGFSLGNGCVCASQGRQLTLKFIQSIIAICLTVLSPSVIALSPSHIYIKQVSSLTVMVKFTVKQKLAERRILYVII